MTVLLAAALAVLLHPDSLSTTRLEVQGDEVWLTMRVQVLSLLEVLPELDADADGTVDAGEVTAQAPAILHYVGEHYRLVTGSDRDLSGGRPLAPQPVAARLVPAGSEEARGFRQGAVDVELVLAAPGPVEDLLVESRLFALTSPAHIDILTIVWPDGARRTLTLDEETPRGRSDPSGRGAGLAFLQLGWRHILSGWDHLAFLLALVLASARVASLLGVVTAFTLAHSVTLGLAALDLVQVSRYATLVEALIALSVAYVAADTALQPRRLRSRWKEALVFGLIHGLGFAGFLRESLVQEEARVLALATFNLGVELGQVAVVLGLVALLRLVPRGAEGGAGDAAGLAPLAWRRWGSWAVALLGLWWFAQRI